MIQKRVCSKCDSIVQPSAYNSQGPTTFSCPRHGEITFDDTHPVGKRVGARKGWHIKTWMKNQKKNVLAKVSRRRNR